MDTTTKTEDEMIDHINEVWEAAAADVEADFPDAECGWETDVARTVIMSEVSDGVVTRAVAAEWFRCQFGCRL